MRVFYLSIFCALLAGCSDPPTKNGGTTNSDTNTGTMNGDTGCSDNADCARDQECVEGACMDHLSCSTDSEDCPPGTTLAEVNGEQGCFTDCPTGTCDGDAECHSGLCIGGSGTNHLCYIQWTECADDKDYEVVCDGSECTCIVNDVEGSTFETTLDCEDDAFHREANAGCGWLVPARD